jgi:uracil-DNA glycosylase
MNWKEVLSNEINSEKFRQLNKEIKTEYKNRIIFPKEEDIYRAFKLCKFDNLKVVIIGQDPYHGEGEANGLAFSVSKNIKTPPSLRNIFKELKLDLNVDRINTDLSDWAKQGVLLLNTVLTVEKDKPKSHSGKGWERFTTNVVVEIVERKKNIVYILWGKDAQQKSSLINNDNLIIKSAHPSPLSATRGFFNSKPFSRTNKYLKENDIDAIKWG